MKDVSEGKIIEEFIGLKSKMHSMKTIDGKESNTAKGVNIATEFNEFKDILFKKKIKTQNEKNSKQRTKLEHRKSTKYNYRLFMIKDLF